METIKAPIVEYGVAKFVLPGQEKSGDQYIVRCNDDGVLLAAIDGIGHGEAAANASKTAASILMSSVNTPVIPLVERCHEQLRTTRGVVLSVASIDVVNGLMTWLGVGNVIGVLTRGENVNGSGQETLLLRGGVVGSQLPPLQATMIPITKKDTLYFVTDGIRSEFAGSLTPLENPQRAADRILKQFWNGNDDALVLVVRLVGIRRQKW